jgi:hypothetical protein
LRLNPGDNQGLRYRQANWLLALESYDELEELFAVHAGDGNAPGFTYTRALAAFARRGAGGQARALLGEARELNPHIPSYLTGRKKLLIKAPRLHGVRRRERSGRLRRWCSLTMRARRGADAGQ